MSDDSPRRILVIGGPGFADQGDLLQRLRFDRNVHLSVFDLGAGPTQVLIEEARSADLVLLRAPWTATPDEMLYASLLAERLRPSLDLLRERLEKDQPVRVVGIGRGALVLRHSNLDGAEQLGRCKWTSDLKDPGPWSAVRIGGVKGELYAQLQGRSLPEIPVGTPGSLRPWVTLISGQVAGWKLSRGVYASFVDILALGDRAQLADYGYVDLSGISTQVDVLNSLVSGQAFSD